MKKREPPQTPEPPAPPPRSGAKQPVGFVDRRAEFERLAQTSPRDADAERVWLESKIDLVRRDPHMTEVAKQQLIARFRRLIRDLKKGPDQ